MALMGESPQWVQNLGDAFLAQPQDVMSLVQRLRQLVQQISSLKSSMEQKIITATRRIVPVNQSVNTLVAQSNTASTSNLVVAKPAPTAITIEPANPDVIYIPNYNPNMVYGSWANTAYPLVYLPPPAGEPFAGSFVRGLGYSMDVATTYALFSSIDWDNDNRDHYHHDSHDHRHYGDDDYHRYDDGHRNSNDWQHSGGSINANVNNFNRITGRHLTDKSMTRRHSPNCRDDISYHDQDMAKRSHRTDVKGGMSTTPLPVPTRDSQRQAVASQPQQRAHAAPVIMRDTQRQAAVQRSNKAEHYGNHDDLRGFSRHQSLTQQQEGAARQCYQSAPPEQHQAARERVQTNLQNQRRREAARQCIQSAPLEQRRAVREKIQTNPQNQRQRDAARQHIQPASLEQRQVFREKVQENRLQRLNDSNHTTRLNNE